MSKFRSKRLKQIKKKDPNNLKNMSFEAVLDIMRGR